jgi:hypothetical protein
MANEQVTERRDSKRKVRGSRCPALLADVRDGGGS